MTGGLWAIANVVISAVGISVTSWMATKNPKLAGLLLSLPLSTLLALALNHTQYNDRAMVVAYARSIFAGLPLSLTFFLPFLFADRLRFPFWGLYLSGVLCLTTTYFLYNFLSSRS